MIKQLRSLKNPKAVGPVRIPTELLKSETETLKEMFVILFEKYTNRETIPESWKEAWVMPIYK